MDITTASIDEVPLWDTRADRCTPTNPRLGSRIDGKEFRCYKIIGHDGYTREQYNEDRAFNYRNGFTDEVVFGLKKPEK